MVHSGLILEYDNIFSDLTWYCYHGVEVSSLNPSSGSKPRNRWKDFHSRMIMKGYVWWCMVWIPNSTSVGESVRESIFTKSSSWNMLQVYIYIKENDGCIIEHNQWFVKIGFSFKGTQHQE